MMVGPPQSHDPYLSQQVPPNQTYQNQPPANYHYKKSENSTTDLSNLDGQDAAKGNKLLINQLRSSASSSSSPSNTSMLSAANSISILTASTSATLPPSNSAMTPLSMPAANFPANCVEATTIAAKTKRKKLSAKDVSMYPSLTPSSPESSCHFSSSSCRSMETDDVITWWPLGRDHVGVGHHQYHAGRRSDSHTLSLETNAWPTASARRHLREMSDRAVRRIQEFTVEHRRSAAVVERLERFVAFDLYDSDKAGSPTARLDHLSRGIDLVEQIPTKI